jgi:hypothetical protein
MNTNFWYCLINRYKQAKWTCRQAQGLTSINYLFFFTSEIRFNTRSKWYKPVIFRKEVTYMYSVFHVSKRYENTLESIENGRFEEFKLDINHSNGFGVTRWQNIRKNNFVQFFFLKMLKFTENMRFIFLCRFAENIVLFWYIYNPSSAQDARRNTSRYSCFQTLTKIRIF